MNFWFIAPYPPSLNKLYAYNKFSKQKYLTSEGKEYKLKVVSIIKRLMEEQSIKKITSLIDFQVYDFPPDMRKRDKDNILKILQDSITLSGLWEDDSLIGNLMVFKGGQKVSGGRLVIFISGFEQKYISPEIEEEIFS